VSVCRARLFGVTPTVRRLGGRILDRSGEPLRNATVEIWQCDANGAYLHSGTGNAAKRDGNFQGFGRFVTGSTGEYVFRTIKPVPYPGRTPHVHFAVKQRLPATYPNESWVESGGLMTYGTNLTDLWRRAAVFVDKILKGTKPADIPVEQPTKFEFAINLKAAKQMGLTIPPNVLARADRVSK